MSDSTDVKNSLKLWPIQDLILQSRLLWLLRNCLILPRSIGRGGSPGLTPICGWLWLSLLLLLVLLVKLLVAILGKKLVTREAEVNVTSAVSFLFILGLMHDGELAQLRVREILESEVIHGKAGVRGVEARLRVRDPSLGQP